ncbi:MAG: GntR family transcriptional regulator, transcriptional repressor for pyruvate dehydrogenase complex [Solirubrobacteraceae bacterium]|jgi:GntR family transcriptional repressor for pyruvate dehydrogenase complex|nr:GntR family transcriptional regulator, transcriptional repressor for pyruvate dehydrogenase complex [Solirubrobacteraceae bacterium]MEA2360610.1 GntR family transcriptional regulator, transcriptional repressor for pyruvate dehydrogenase complex [Solirubrobacteraceae bacterium]MEA2396274.1 GntR family transcriptional regulator, transcriptional repressor for pyruvate dehydrogenase complex [Solirubrobacteraceae bacterium]
MSETQPHPTRSSPLYEEVVDRLRALIDDRGLQPGDRLMSERELAQELGVSRTSVRQAMTALKVMGLVDIRHGTGIYLLSPPDAVLPTLTQELLQTHARMPAIMEAREAVETQNARLAATRRTDAELAEMGAALDAMQAAIEAGEQGIEEDRRFHAAITAAAHNPVLAGLMADLAESIDQTRHASLAQPGRPPRSLAAHRAILAGIVAGDPDRAAAAMREHLREVADLVFAPRAGGPD